MIITDYKPVGITCGQLIKKKCYSKFTEIAYVGILDPMAHGVITILTDKDLSKMDEYMKRSPIVYVEKTKEEYEIDKIVSKKTMVLLQDFFKTSWHQETRKIYVKIKNKRNATLKRSTL
jgi:hypothetical protein